MKRRGISPAITTILLIGVAVAGGISAGVAMRNQTEIISKTTKIDVIKVDLIAMYLTNKTFFATSLKNTGTITILSGDVGFYNDGVFYSLDIPRLEPGQTFGAKQVFDTGVVMNQKYLINVRIVASDGSTYEWAETQTAAGA
ncbi:MAG: archaellin/type IV pilin N-terminal domain-containing protein [Candidatus Nitrosotenuis sp.]